MLSQNISDPRANWPRATAKVRGARLQNQKQSFVQRLDSGGRRFSYLQLLFPLEARQQRPPRQMRTKPHKQDDAIPGIVVGTLDQVRRQRNPARVSPVGLWLYHHPPSCFLPVAADWRVMRGLMNHLMRAPLHKRERNIQSSSLCLPSPRE